MTKFESDFNCVWQLKSQELYILQTFGQLVLSKPSIYVMSTLQTSTLYNKN